MKVADHNPTTPAGGRREVKAAIRAARRSVLVQCSRCGATGSGTTNYRNRVVSTSLAGTSKRHADCGGEILAFDIEVGR